MIKKGLIVFLITLIVFTFLAWIIAPRVYCVLGNMNGLEHAISEDCQRAATDSELMEAGLNFEKALAINPSLPEAHLGLGRVLKSLQHNDEAMQHFSYAIAKNNHFAEAFCERAKLYFQRGNWDKCIADSNEFLQRTNGSSDGTILIERENIFRLRHRAFVRADELDKALVTYKKERADHPEDNEILLYQASAFRRTDQNQKLIEALSNYIAREQLKHDLSYYNSQKRLGTKMYPDNLKASLPPKLATAYQCRAEAYIKSGDIEAASKDYERALLGRIASRGISTNLEHLQSLIDQLHKKHYSEVANDLKKELPCHLAGEH